MGKTLETRLAQLEGPRGEGITRRLVREVAGQLYTGTGALVSTTRRGDLVLTTRVVTKGEGNGHVESTHE